MAITKYQNTTENQDKAKATPDPKQIWVDGVWIIVYTGDDYLPYAPAPTEIDAQTYVNQMPDEQLDWALDQAFGSSPDPDTRRTLFRKFFSSPGVTVDFGDSSVSALQNKIT